MTSLILWTALTTPSHACGGFFCNREEPVNQNAERIVFSIDQEAGKVETHVQISFEGDAEDFAWVVPTPAVPELFTSTEELFTELERATMPLFERDTIEEGPCKDEFNRGGTSDEVAFADSAGGGSQPVSDESVTVVVVSEERVGAYDTVTLQAQDSAALLEWLQTNGYDLPDELAPAMDPYIASDAFFLALRLAKDADTGDLTPLGMRYAGDVPVIPLQLTRVAASPDLRLRVWVLSDGRAVPDNYLHVGINEVAVDWFANLQFPDGTFSSGANYDDLITRAADEAGGHGFATDMSGSTADLAAAMDRPEWSDEAMDQLASSGSASAFMNNLQSAGFTGTNALLVQLSACVELPPGVSAQDFFNCPDCYDDVAFDAETCTEQLREGLVEPVRRVQEQLARYPHVTRLTSSISPAEMTVDPSFVINPDMPDIDRVRTAVEVFECSLGRSWSAVPRRLELPSGLVVPLPSYQWMWNNNVSYLDWVERGGDIAAWTIEETSTDAPMLISDHRDEVADILADIAANASTPVGGVAGCGCGTTGGGSSWWLMPLVWMAASRRRTAGPLAYTPPR